MKNNNTKNTKFAFILLKKLTPHFDREELNAEFQQLYGNILNSRGKAFAGFWLWIQILKSIPGFISAKIYWSYIMFKNYLKIAFRNIKRHKTFSFINIFGLAIGMTCFIFIMLYIQYEFSYDHFHENGDNICRIIAKEPANIFAGKNIYTTTQGNLAPTLMEEFPEVIYATRFSPRRVIISKNKNNVFHQSGLIADEYFLKIFTFTLVQGNKNSALNAPFSIIISEKLAKKLFSDENPIGKTVNLNNNLDLTVTGVHQNVPENSHFYFEFIISLNMYLNDPARESRINTWTNSSFRTYVLLKNNYSFQEFEKKLIQIRDKYVGDSRTGKNGEKYMYYVQSLKSIHIHSDINFELSENSDIKYIYLLWIVGLLILIIACINYINLSTACLLKRAGEIGIRKVVGAQKKQLFFQFLGEAFLFSFLAFIFSLIAAYLILPLFNSFTEKNIIFNLSKNLVLTVILSGTVVFTGVISGIYPAVFLSSFKPVKILKNFSGSLTKTSGMRNFLITGQFCILLILIICSLIVKNQMKFINSKDLGYNPAEVIQIRMDSDNYNANYTAMKQSLMSNPDIKMVASGNSNPVSFINKLPTLLENNNGEFFRKHCNHIMIDPDYLDLFQMEIKSGRKFSPDFSTDEKETIIVNEAMVRDMGWDNPIGKRFRPTNKSSNRTERKVIGVIKDFHFASFHTEIQPLIIVLRKSDNYRIFIKINPDNKQSTIEYIKKTSLKFNPGYPFVYEFLKDRFDQLYRSEDKLARILLCFSMLAIIIACLGLFGLAFYTTELRTKEIGVRKVLGASIPGIVILLSRDFSKWVIIANIIAWPVAYFIMSRWLQNFVYRADINITLFIISGVFALIIALVTISHQVLKTANANPVNALRYE